ncbi:MAG TPA: hypothetical protein DD706_22480 [Nitrospiraceae bacterium]|nr:hypothetical protein [Nitrospiraceae bacterium]
MPEIGWEDGFTEISSHPLRLYARFQSTSSSSSLLSWLANVQSVSSCPARAYANVKLKAFCVVIWSFIFESSMLNGRPPVPAVNAFCIPFAVHAL